MKLNKLNKNTLVSVAVGSIMLLYLYIDTPLPFTVVFGDLTFILLTVVSLVASCFIYQSTNIFVTIIYLVVLYELMKKVKLQKYKNLIDNRNPSAAKNYYYKEDPNVIVSNRFDKSLSLEEEMVNNIVPKKLFTTLNRTDKVQPVLPNLSQSFESTN